MPEKKPLSILFRTVTIPHFSTLRKREGEAYPRLAMWWVLKERSVHPAQSLCLWASGRWGTIPAFVRQCCCTLAVYCTKWQCENHVKIPPRACMNSASFGPNQAFTGTMSHFFLFLLNPNKKKMPRLMPQRLRAQTNMTFWGCCFVVWVVHTVWVMSRMCTALVPAPPIWSHNRGCGLL